MAKTTARTPPPAPPQMVEDPDFAEMGPKLQALKPKQRLFCWYFAHNGGDASNAYQLAYPDMTSDLGARVNASRLRARADIREALAELAKFQFNALTMPAIRALAHVLDNPSHKQYAKVAGYVLDRSGFMPEQMVKHEHVHKLDASQVDDKLTALATLLGVGVANLMAPPKPALPPPVDAVFEEVKELVEPKEDEIDPENPDDW